MKLWVCGGVRVLSHGIWNNYFLKVSFRWKKNFKITGRQHQSIKDIYRIQSCVQMPLTKSRLLERLGCGRKCSCLEKTQTKFWGPDWAQTHTQCWVSHLTSRFLHLQNRMIEPVDFQVQPSHLVNPQLVSYSIAIHFPHQSSTPIKPSPMYISWPTTADPSATLADIAQHSPELEIHLAGFREAGQNTHPSEVGVSLFPPNHSSEHGHAELQHRANQHHRQSSLKFRKCLQGWRCLSQPTPSCLVQCWR